jgi:hypothetical protein
MVWLASQGAQIYIPVGHSPDVDLVALLRGRAMRVQVKTTSVFRKGRWEVRIATSGGNQSWNGLVKRFAASRCDVLFVHAGDGRRWLIPSSEVDGTVALRLGGPKYEAHEIEPGTPLPKYLEAAGHEGQEPDGEEGGSSQLF